MMFEQLSKQLRAQSGRPTPLYSQLALVLVLGAILTGWLVYAKVADQLERLTQKQVIALEESQTKSIQP